MHLFHRWPQFVSAVIAKASQLLLLTLILASAASAQSFSARLTPAQTAPPGSGIPGTGSVTVTLLGDGSSLLVDLHAANLFTFITGVGIFAGAPGVNGPLALNALTAAGTGTVVVGERTVDITKTYSSSALWSGLREGQPFYAGIASSNYPFPTGLIRGDLIPVTSAAPEPLSGALMLAVLPLFGIVAGRRRANR